jgi:chemotaxis protein CheD
MDTNSQFATNVYYDRTFDCDAAKILPGEYYYTGKDMLIVTVLGSCVSACIRDRVTGLGGMNHFMLPDGGDPAIRSRPRCATAATRWKC